MTMDVEVNEQSSAHKDDLCRLLASVEAIASYARTLLQESVPAKWVDPALEREIRMLDNRVRRLRLSIELRLTEHQLDEARKNVTGLQESHNNTLEQLRRLETEDVDV